MKIKEGYRIRKVGSKSVVVAPGGINFTGLITVNETGTFIWGMLERVPRPMKLFLLLLTNVRFSPRKLKAT